MKCKAVRADENIVGIASAAVHACCRRYCICVIFDCRAGRNTVDTRPQHIRPGCNSASTDLYVSVSVLYRIFCVLDGFIASIYRMRALRCISHSCTANAERVAYFLGEKARDKLSAKTSATNLDAAREHLLKTVAALA